MQTYVGVSIVVHNHHKVDSHKTLYIYKNVYIYKNSYSAPKCANKYKVVKIFKDSFVVRGVPANFQKITKCFQHNVSPGRDIDVITGSGQSPCCVIQPRCNDSFELSVYSLVPVRHLEHVSANCLF